MARRALTLAQSRFLGDHLYLCDFERKLVQSPARFLNDLVRGFRLNQPFQTVNLISELKNGLKFAKLSMEARRRLYESEIMTGRGGSCFTSNAFLANFLNSVGFDAHIVFGFTSARSSNRDSLHVVVGVKNVEEEGDIYHCDVGAMIPIMRATKVDLFGASPIRHDVQLSYQVVGTRNLEEVMQDGSRFFSPTYEFEHFADLKEENGVALLIANDDVVKCGIPHLADEDQDAWFPFHVFPDFLHGMDLVNVFNFLQDETVPLALKLPRGRAKGLLVSGFGKKSRDFFLINGRTVVTYPGTNHDLVNDDVIIDATKVEPKIFQATNDNEVLDVIVEEFPPLTEYCRDAIELSPILEREVQNFFSAKQ